MFTGTAIDAAEAARIGLANRVVPDDALLADSLAVAKAIAGHSVFAMGISKRALHASLAAPSLELALELEARGQAYATRSADFPAALAGIRAQIRH